MGTHYSKTFAADERKSGKRKGFIIGATLAGILGFGGVAIAAMVVESNEANATVEAGTAQKLDISDAKASDKLYPGMGVDLTFTAKNPNPFPVTLTSIVAGSGQPSISCAVAGDVKHLSSALEVSGSTVKLATAVVVAPGETETVKLVKAVKLAPAAEGGCTLKGSFRITGSGAGSGN